MSSEASHKSHETLLQWETSAPERLGLASLKAKSALGALIKLSTHYSLTVFYSSTYTHGLHTDISSV